MQSTAIRSWQTNSIIVINPLSRAAFHILERHSRRIELYCELCLVETPFTNATRVFYVVISPSYTLCTVHTMYKTTTKQSLNVLEMEVGWQRRASTHLCCTHKRLFKTFYSTANYRIMRGSYNSHFAKRFIDWTREAHTVMERAIDTHRLYHAQPRYSISIVYYNL